MGEHADAPADTLIVDGDSKPKAPQQISPMRATVAVSAAAFVVLGGLAGWLGYQLIADRQAQLHDEELVQAARQGAVNLTTLDHATVDADVQRILDSSTGVFHDDFEKRSEPFADAVRQAQSTSKGTVTAAGLVSQDGDKADVLVMMSVAMSAAGAPEEQPRSWRMRISVQKDGDVTKMSDVQFVP